MHLECTSFVMTPHNLLVLTSQQKTERHNILLKILKHFFQNPNSDNTAFLCLKFQHIYNLNSVFFTATNLKWVRNSYHYTPRMIFQLIDSFGRASEASECAAAPIKFLLSHTIRH